VNKTLNINSVLDLFIHQKTTNLSLIALYRTYKYKKHYAHHWACRILSTWGNYRIYIINIVW